MRKNNMRTPKEKEKILKDNNLCYNAFRGADLLHGNKKRRIK